MNPGKRLLRSFLHFAARKFSASSAVIPNPTRPAEWKTAALEEVGIDTIMLIASKSLFGSGILKRFFPKISQRIFFESIITAQGASIMMHPRLFCGIGAYLQRPFRRHL
jgi:hypothetical protein